MRTYGVLARLVALSVAVAACGGGASPSPTTMPTPSVTPAATGSLASPSEVVASPNATREPTVAPPSAWVRLTPAGETPAGREDHTWTVDEAGGTAYLFGGRDGSTVHGDLWAYDLAGDTWRRLEPEGATPPARFGHEAAWIPDHGLIVFGGQAGSQFFGDLWLFDPSSDRWVALPAAGEAPVARYGSCSAVSPDGRFWISHGFTENGVRFDDTRTYDLEARRWVDETPAGELPVRRCLHVCWWADGRLALYSGQTNGVPALGDLWALGPLGSSGAAAGWEALGNPLPLDRNLVAAATVGDEVVLFGGRDRDGQPVMDLHVVQAIDAAFEVIPTVGTGPTARWAATLVHDAERGRLLLFGGTDGSATNAETWALTVP